MRYGETAVNAKVKRQKAKVINSSARAARPQFCLFTFAFCLPHGWVSTLELLLRRCGRVTVTPVVREADSAIRADAHSADQHPATGSRATLRGGRGEQFGRETLLGVENLNARQQAALFEFRQALVNEQSACRLHRFLTPLLNRLRDPQLDLALVADVR